jgi:hypothetical protein
MRAISRAHAGFFAPAEFTQAIWGLIFGTLLVYGAAQALPRHARSPTLDRLAKPMFLANFLMAAWTVAFKSELAASAFLLVTAVWMLAVAMLTEVHGGMQKERGARAWHIPISLLAGWLTVTLLSSMGTALVDSGWIRGSTALVPITVVMIGYAALVATLFSAEFVDPIVPLVGNGGALRCAACLCAARGSCRLRGGRGACRVGLPDSRLSRDPQRPITL